MGKDELRKLYELVKYQVFLAAIESYKRCNQLENNDPKYYVPNVEAIVKHIESHYISKESVRAAIGPDETGEQVPASCPNNSPGCAVMHYTHERTEAVRTRNELRQALRQELGLEK
jgi:hypothetical protein